MKVHALLADGEIASVNFFRDGVEAVSEIEVDEARLFVLDLVKRGSLLELAAQVGELVIPPNLLQTKLLALLLIPRVVKVEGAGVQTPVGFLFALFGLKSGCLRSLCGGGILLRLIKIRGRHKHRELG